MGLTPEELADRQRRNRERHCQAKAAKLAAKALAAGVSVVEMRGRIEAEKTAARIARQAADRWRDLRDQAEVLLAEADRRGAVLLKEDLKVLRQMTSSRKRLADEHVAVEAIKRISDAIQF